MLFFKTYVNRSITDMSQVSTDCVIIWPCSALEEVTSTFTPRRSDTASMTFSSTPMDTVSLVAVAIELMTWSKL